MADGITDADRAIAQARLSALVVALRDAEYPCELVQAPGVDYPALSIGVPDTDAETGRVVSVLVLPTDTMVSATHLLQLLLDLGPAAPDPAALAEANRTAVLGSAIVADGHLHHRLVWPVGAGTEIESAEIDEILTLFLFAADTIRAALG